MESHFSIRDLMSACGREMHFSGARKERIEAIKGHSGTRTMMKYLGLDQIVMEDDMPPIAFQNQLTHNGASFQKSVNGCGGYHKWIHRGE